MEKFDVAIIGGGPSGYAAAMRALDFGKSVAIIEQKKMGGAGLHDGALSSKTFWEMSRQHEMLSHHLRKGNHPPSVVEFSDVSSEVHDAVHYRMNQLDEHLRMLAEAGRQIKTFRGKGKLISANEIEITGNDSCTIYAENIVLATGSRPRKLPNIPVDEVNILTSDGIDHLDHFPESLVILGAGVIGCEFATIFANFGKTKVYLIDKAERILPSEDDDLSDVIGKNLERRGVTIHKGATFERMEIKEGKVEYEVSFSDGRREIFHVEKALISVGRIPNIEETGAKEIGIQLDARSHVVTDDSRTSIPNIYAVGDLTADIALVNVGELEGRHAVEKMYGSPKALCYDNISTIMFLCPETAGVGMNEQQARQNKIPYRAASIHYGVISRAIAMRQTEGFFKILINPDTFHILGMRAVGEHASSAIQAVALLIATGETADILSELIHPHPSIIEGIQECVRMLKGKSIFKPEMMGTLMSLVSWKP